MEAKQMDRYRQKVYKVLTEQRFVISEKDKKHIEEKISNGRRYFFGVFKRREGKKLVERFIKIPINNTGKLLMPFKRQVEFAKYIKRNKIIKTRGVVGSNTSPKKGIPFVIMETFPVGHSKIGFIEGNNGAELLTAREAKKTMQELLRLHEIKVSSIPKTLKKILVNKGTDLEDFRRHLIRDLNKRVKPVDFGGRSEYFHRVIEKRLGVKDLKEKVNNFFEVVEVSINKKENKGQFLAHGDMAPNNLYIFNSGDVELLDLEWVSIFPNKAISMIFDFGNLHARSWKSRVYRVALEEILFDYYKKQGREGLGRAILGLSVLRSHLHHSSYFENYDWKKQEQKEERVRRETVEQDTLKAWDFIQPESLLN